MNQKQDIRYDNLYAEMLQYVKELHEKNKKRIKTGIVLLFVLPVVLGLVRWLTDSDKTVFLILWVIGMFILAAYLISIEYMDHTIQEKLKTMTDTEEDLGGLLDDYDCIPEKVIRKVERKWKEAKDEEHSEDHLP